MMPPGLLRYRVIGYAAMTYAAHAFVTLQRRPVLPAKIFFLPLPIRFTITASYTPRLLMLFMSRRCAICYHATTPDIAIRSDYVDYFMSC